jgi:hypothetical protein
LFATEPIGYIRLFVEIEFVSGTAVMLYTQFRH